MFLLRYYHRAASNCKICFVRRVINGARGKREKERESRRVVRRCSRVAGGRGIGRLSCRLRGWKTYLPTYLPMVVPWLRGRDHNLYNGLAKVYPESRFCEETGMENRGEQTLSVRSYGRCIIIAPSPSSSPHHHFSLPLLPNRSSHHLRTGCILFTMYPHTSLYNRE